MSCKEGEKKMYWKEILKVYKSMGVESIIPIAHTRIKPNVKVLIDESGNFVGAMLNEQDRFTIPCTIESESRTSGCAPHPIHDNMQYLCNEYDDQKCKEKHESYMKQLKEYIEEVDDELAKSVYRFLKKGLLRECIKDFLGKVNLPEEKVMICFVMVTRETLTRASMSDEYEGFCLYALRAGDGQDFQWRDYYLKKLEPNGICSITGKPDFIPPTYPKAIRNSRDAAKLFVGGSIKKIKENLDGMPTINPGYVITQKIVHTLQCMNYEGAQWVYQMIRENKGITNEIISEIENEREMTEEEKKRFEKKIVKSFNKMAQNKEWMAKKNGEEYYDD